MKGKSAINNMKKKKKNAAGSDEISPRFLEPLGPVALEEILRIFNKLFLHPDCP